MNFQQILFPTDFSERSASASKYVAAMAALFHSKITLVHAVDDPLGWYGSTDPEKAVEIDLPKARSESAESLARFAQAHFPGTEVATVAEVEGPLELIEQTAQTVHADLIMMATHGYGRFRAALLGSTTAKVLHDLTIPVWTDVHQEENPSEYRLPVRTVACAIDLGPESASVLRSAADFAKSCGAAMFIAHGVPVAEMRLGAYGKIEPPVYMQDFARTEIEKLQREAGTAAETCIESGPIASVVRNAALERQADVVVMGRGSIAHFGGRLGAHLYAIVRESPCPVLSF